MDLDFTIYLVAGLLSNCCKLLTIWTEKEAIEMASNNYRDTYTDIYRNR